MGGPENGLRPDAVGPPTGEFTLVASTKRALRGVRKVRDDDELEVLGLISTEVSFFSDTSATGFLVSPSDILRGRVRLFGSYRKLNVLTLEVQS